MLHTTKQVRSYNLKNTIKLTLAMIVAVFWPKDSVILTGKEVTTCNILSDIMAMFEAEKTYKIGTLSITGQGIYDKVTDFLGLHEQETMIEIISGNHRYLAGILAQALFDIDIVSTMVFAEAQDAEESYFANRRHNACTRLDLTNEVKSVLALMDDGTITKESELWQEGNKDATRASAINVFGRAKLVRYHDIDIEDAVSLTAKELTEVKKSSNKEQAVADIMQNGHKPTVKACKRADQAELIEYANSRHLYEVANVLTAIYEGNKLSAMDCIKNMS